MRIAVLVLGAALASGGAAQAADFRSRNAPDPIGTTALVVTLDGTIVNGDVERFGREAYRAAVDGISLLIQLSDHLYVEPTELPRLLEPGRDSAFLVDTVDAVRSLWIDYDNRKLSVRREGDCRWEALKRRLADGESSHRRSSVGSVPESSRLAAAIGHSLGRSLTQWRRWSYHPAAPLDRERVGASRRADALGT